jgi:hypothetical protein
VRKVAAGWLAAALAAAANPATAAVVTYTPSQADFPNPERGFFVGATYDLAGSNRLSASPLQAARAQGTTLFHINYLLGQYRNGALPNSALTRIKADLATARKAGVKVVPRFAYNFGPIGAADAPKARILAHIGQLGPVLRTNADVIAHVQAGFIGAWGEWHSSTNGLENVASRREILTKLLQVLPEERMVLVRTPRYKQEIYGTTAPLTQEEAFSGTNRARTGAHNDCFLASTDDWGTYKSDNSMVIEAEKTYLSLDNRFVPQSGETCNAGAEAKPLIGCANALKELSRMRWTALNSEYHHDVLARWEAEGCLGEVKRRLGYRFTLVDADIPSSAQSGGEIAVNLTMRNDGWASPTNPRPVEIVLRHQATGTATILTTKTDARAWQPGTHKTKLAATLPGTLASGTYRVLLALRDPAKSIRPRPEYAIRLANEGLWESATGFNDLRATVTVVGAASKIGS